MKLIWILILPLAMSIEALASGAEGTLVKGGPDVSIKPIGANADGSRMSFSHLVDPSLLIELIESEDGFSLYAQYESPIHSLGVGKVVYVGNFGEYKNLVIVNHGDRVLSAYSHFERVLVTEGQQINPKVVLGLASDLPLAISIRKAGKLLKGDQLTALLEE